MPEPPPFTPGGDPAPSAPLPATVLLITADEVLLQRIQESLALGGLTCLTARSGAAAFERFDRADLELILVDLALPDRLGVELLERQRNAPGSVPCMALIRPGQERMGLELVRWGCALDCLVNDAQMFERLVPDVQRALQRLSEQRRLETAQEVLRQSEAQHRAVFELASVGMMEVDPHTGHFLRVNEKFCELIGYSAQELRLKCFREVIGPEEREADWDTFQRAVRGEARDYRSEQRCLRKDGSTVWVHVNMFILRDAQGRPVLGAGMAEDVTKRKQAEEALRASEARYRALVHATSASVWRLTPDGERQLSLEGGVIRGHREPEAQPGEWLGRIHPEDRSRTQQAWRRAVATQSLYEIEHRVMAADGCYRYLLARGVPVRDGEGRVLEWIGASTDITARKRVEGALRESEERFRRVSESGFISISFFNTDGRITGANDAFLNLIGFSRAELNAGRLRWDQLTPPEWLPRTREALEELKATGRIRPYEKEYFRRDGSRFWALVGATTLGGGQEGVAFVLDVTERKRAEVELREREAQLAIAQKVGRIGVWGRDLVRRTNFVTKEWCEIVGIEDPASVRDLRDFLAFVHPDDRARLTAADRQLIGRGTGNIEFEMRILHPARGERWMLARAQCVPSADGKGSRLLGVIIDVTEQKRAEEELRLSEERLRFAAQAAGFGTYELDLVTGQAYRSPEYKALFGLGSNDEFKLDTDQVPIYVHPDDRALLREATRESRDAQGSGTKDVEYRVILPDGTVRWLLVRGRTLFEGAGRARRPVRSRGIALDVTGRKQLEQEILDISGLEQRRIGHDLHDDLCQRLGGLQLLSGVLEKELAAENHPQASQAGRIASQVHEALERARLLARGLAPVAVEEGGLTTALEQLADNSAQLFHIQCEFHGELPVGIADAGAATHLYRITQEAITNAVKHGRAKRVVIGLTDAGDNFKLKVIDDGRGFNRAKVAAAGMGLRIMKYRAEMLGAVLEVHSLAGQGTTVTCAFGKGLCSARRPTKQRVRMERSGQTR